MNEIKGRVQQVFERIFAASRRVGRNPSTITLVAASKTAGLEAIVAAHQAGIQVFGENRVQELLEKAAAHPNYCWHFIGRLQRNKARPAVEHCQLIHSVDSDRLAETLDRIGQARGAGVRALVEVNIGGEASKGGVDPTDLISFLERHAARPGLRIEGLMTIPPPGSPAVTREYFRSLARFAEQAQRRNLDGVTIQELSMGMSHDFELAIEEGATLVRVGTAIFGPRRST